MLVGAIALALDTVGSAVVMGAVILVIGSHLRSLGAIGLIRRQQRLLAQGIVLALTFKSGAGMLRTVLVHGWSDLAQVSAIIALRFALGRVLQATATGVGG